MARLPIRCLRGERLIGKMAQGHWKITTFVAALRRTSVTAPGRMRIITSLILDMRKSKPKCFSLII